MYTHKALFGNVASVVKNEIKTQSCTETVDDHASGGGPNRIQVVLQSWTVEESVGRKETSTIPQS